MSSEKGQQKQELSKRDKNEAQEHSWAYKVLREQKKGTEIYVVIRSVSRVAVCRTADAFIIENGHLQAVCVDEVKHHVNHRSDGCSAFYRLRGCDMDMAFKLVYDLGRAVHGDGYYFIKRDI